MISVFQPLQLGVALYMRNRSAANSAASSPPVPARTSRMALRSSAASLGSSAILQLLLELLDARLERLELGARHADHLLVGRRDRRSSPRDRRAPSRRLAQRPRSSRRRAEVGEFLGELGIDRLADAVVELGLDRAPALDQPVEFVFRNGGHGRGACAISNGVCGAERRRRFMPARRIWAPAPSAPHLIRLPVDCNLSPRRRARIVDLDPAQAVAHGREAAR